MARSEGPAPYPSRNSFDQRTAQLVSICVSGKYLSINLHIIWSTKGRSPLLRSEWRSQVHSYMSSVAASKNAKLIEVGSQPDHVHLYVSMPSTITIADLVNALKANTTRWIRGKFENRRMFTWQSGYAAFSVSKSVEGTVLSYIRNQDDHHKRRDFKEELLDLLARHGIEYDPRFIFD